MAPLRKAAPFALTLLAFTASAFTFEVDGEKKTVGETKVQVARAALKQCFSATEASDQSDCQFFHRFKKACGYELPTEFNDEAIALGLLYGNSGAGDAMGWADKNYGLLNQMCTNMTGHETYKTVFPKKLKKIVFDGKRKKAKDGHPSITLKNGELTFGLAPLGPEDTGGLIEWVNDPRETLYAFLKDSL